jgi:DNA-binding MarR family transcriptional regulator
VRIEEEIKQVKFKSEQHKLMINLLFTSSWLHRAQLCALRVGDITPQQYNILRILRGNKKNTTCIGDINARMIDKSSNTSRLIDKLLKKELIDREVNDADRRQMHIRITQAGLNLLDQLENPMEEAAEPFLKLSVKDAKWMNAFLDELRNNQKQNKK